MELSDENVRACELLSAIRSGSVDAKTAAAAWASLEKQTGIDMLWLLNSELSHQQRGITTPNMSPRVSSDEGKNSAVVRDRLRDFVHAIISEGRVEISDVLNSLDPEFVFLQILKDTKNFEILRKKKLQYRTKTIYNLPIFNLIRDCPEGYAAAIELFDRLLASPNTSQDLTYDVDSFIQQVIYVIGQFNLSPTRIAVMAINALAINFEDPSDILRTNRQITERLLAVLKMVGMNRVSGALRFLLLATSENSSKLRDSVMKMQLPWIAGFLFSHDLVYIREVFPLLTAQPDDSNDSNTREVFVKRYQEIASKLNVDQLEISRFFQELAELKDQRLEFIAGVLSSVGNNVEISLQLLDAIADSDDIPLGSNIFLRSALNHTLKSLDTSQHVDLRTLERLTSHLGPFVSAETLSLVMKTVCEGLKVAGESSGSSGVAGRSTFDSSAVESSAVESSVVRILADSVFPSISMLGPNPWLHAETWKFLLRIPSALRYEAYALWEESEKIPCALVRANVNFGVKQLLKRVVKDALPTDQYSRFAAQQFSKFASVAPITAFRAMVSQSVIGFNINLINPFIECTRAVTPLAVDCCAFVMSGVLLEYGETKGWLQGEDISWLNSLASFSGKFFAKHSKEAVHCLPSFLHVIANLIQPEILSEDSSDCRYIFERGQARIILDSLFLEMGGCSVLEQINDEQTEALAGGPVLKSLALHQAEGKAVDALSEVLLRKIHSDLAMHNLTGNATEQSLLSAIMSSLLTQKVQLANPQLAYFYGKQIQGSVLAAVQKCLLQVLQITERQNHASRTMSSLPGDDSMLASDVYGLIEQAAHRRLHKERIGVTNKTTKEMYNNLIEGGSGHSGESITEFFWRADLADLHCPSGSYEVQIALLSEKIRISENSNDKGRYARKEFARLKNLSINLQSEFIAASDRVIHPDIQRIENTSSSAPSDDELSRMELAAWFVENCLKERVLFSVEDALMCAHFCNLMISLRAFSKREIIPCVFGSLMLSVVKDCSEFETRCFSVFANKFYQLQQDQLLKDEFLQTIQTGLGAFKPDEDVNNTPTDHVGEVGDDDSSAEENKDMSIVQEGTEDDTGSNENMESTDDYGDLFADDEDEKKLKEADDWNRKRNTLVLLSACVNIFQMTITEDNTLMVLDSEVDQHQTPQTSTASEMLEIIQRLQKMVDLFISRETARDLLTVSKGLAARIKQLMPKEEKKVEDAKQVEAEVYAELKVSKPPVVQEKPKLVNKASPRKRTEPQSPLTPTSREPEPKRPKLGPVVDRKQQLDRKTSDSRRSPRRGNNRR